MSESWIDVGLDTPAEERTGGGADSQRFFLKQGQAAEIMFLSDMNQFYKVKQHEIWVNGKPVFATCCQTDKQSCPLCEAAKTNNRLARREFWIGTVLNLTGYTKDGEQKGQNRRQLFCMNYTAKNLMEAHFEAILDAGKSIRGAIFKMKRTNAEKSLKTGDVPMYVRHGDLDKAEKAGIEIQPFNLLELEEFKPNIELCRRLASGTAPTQGQGSGGGGNFAGGQNFVPSASPIGPLGRWGIFIGDL
jgi:hypothetical protein